MSQTWKPKQVSRARRLIPANQGRSDPLQVLGMTVAVFGVVALGASANNGHLRGHVTINERSDGNIPKIAAPKTMPDLTAQYGTAAISPAIAGAIKRAESEPDARAIAERQEALTHGIWKPGADRNLAVMYGNVPPGMSQQQAAVLYRTLPQLPRMTEPITAEKADRYAGVEDPLAGLPQGMTREDTHAANERMFYGDMRHRSGPICMPPLHRDHNWLAEHARESGNGFVVQNDHQISLISPEFSGGKSGSIREMTDSSGNIVYQQSFDSYGNPAHLQGSGSQPDFGYQGYYVHQRSGLNLTVTRAYSPKFGRFLNRDPIEEFGGPNLFEYAYNNPINLSDPSGLLPTVITQPPPQQQKKECPFRGRPPRRPLPVPGGRGPDCDEGANKPPKQGTNSSINTLADCINWCGHHCSDSPPPPPNPGWEKGGGSHYENCKKKCLSGPENGYYPDNASGTTGTRDK